MMTHIIKKAKKLTKSYFQHRKNLKKPEIKKAVSQKLGITCLVSLLASCQPSYANSGLKSFKSNSDFPTELNKINQLSFFDSFNYVELVAVTSNNDRLSQSNSATPQRQCGFFMSAIQQNGGIAPLCRVYTPKYDTRKGNMGSGSIAPRVKPDTLTISTVSGVSQSNNR